MQDATESVNPRTHAAAQAFRASRWSSKSFVILSRTKCFRPFARARAMLPLQNRMHAHRARRTGRIQMESRARRTRSRAFVLPLAGLGSFGANRTVCSQTTASVAWARTRSAANVAAGSMRPPRRAPWRPRLRQQRSLRQRSLPERVILSPIRNASTTMLA